jgi:mono/diheme cytochrome c family protein
MAKRWINLSRTSNAYYRNMNKKWLPGLGVALLVGVALTLTWLPDKGTQVRGKALYGQYCANCHGDEGEGLGRLIPPMTAPEMHTPERIICAIRHGKRGPVTIGGVNYNGWMLPYRTMEVDEIRDIVNYIVATWGTQQEKPVLSIPEINEKLSVCPKS